METEKRSYRPTLNKLKMATLLERGAQDDRVGFELRRRVKRTSELLRKWDAYKKARVNTH